MVTLSSIRLRLRLRGLFSLRINPYTYTFCTRYICAPFPIACSSCYSLVARLSSINCRRQLLFWVSPASFGNASHLHRLPSGPCRFLATSVDCPRLTVEKDQILEIAGFVVRDEEDLESKLDSLNLRLSVEAIEEVFNALNEKKVCGLRFFCWFRRWQPDMARNSNVCSVFIDNCGHSEDYSTMRSLLKKFKVENICLSKNAFQFLLLHVAREDAAKDATLRIIEILHEAGGSVYASGVHALVECFCSLGFFGMSEFVLQQLERKDTYYNLIIKEMCRRNAVKAARDMIVEMRKNQIQPKIKALNYLISCSCKLDYDVALEVFHEMKDHNCDPDALTFEILISYCCRSGKIDDAFQLVHDMDIRGLEPRLSTHSVIIKALFRLQRYEDAHAYVVKMANKYKCSGNANYSLLASLHQKKGNFFVAKKIVYEMIDIGLCPESKVYIRVFRYRLRKGKTRH